MQRRGVMDFYQLDQFRIIAECGTMREAADRLYVSQPTLSYNLKKLESELDCKLFTREHGRLRITPYGEVVLGYARTIGANLEAMRQDIENAKLREAEILHVGCFSFIVSGFLLPQVASLFPASTFEVVNCSAASLMSGLEEGRFDVVIAPEACRGKSAKWKKLYEEQACVSMPRGIPETALESVDAAHMASLSFNIEAGLLGYSKWFSRILSATGVPVENITQLPYEEHLRIKDTLETCNLITSFIMGYVRTNESRVVVPIDDACACRSIGLLHRADVPEKILPFVKYLTDNIEVLLGGNAFVPFFLNPKGLDNFHVAFE